MNTSTYQGTAQIYQFPVRSRSAVSGHRDNNGAVTDPMSQHISIALGSCWYHEAAITQSLAPTKP
jgi:hypothetical protein